MAYSIFSFVPEDRVSEVLRNLQAFTGLAIQLIDSSGTLLMSFGQSTAYCNVLKKKVFQKGECFLLHMKAGQRAQALGEAYIFSCHANLNHIAFPLINQKELLGSVIIGPFLMDAPDSTLVSDLAERKNLSPTLSLELYDELGSLAVFSPAKVNQLKKLVDHLLSPLMPGERALLLETQQKMSQQARINETIQVYKEEKPDQSPTYLYDKEKQLLQKLRTGTVQEVKGLLNDLIGYVLFSEGGNPGNVRIRAIELTTLLSRVAIEGGARTDSIFRLNTEFLSRLYWEQELEDLCMLMQEVLESFMDAMFSEKDKGNPYIRRALRFMADNYSEHLELAQVAEYVGLSPSYFSKNYQAEAVDTSGVELPDYAHLTKPLVEVFTLDSAQCAACGYMMGAAYQAVETFGDAIDMVEYKFIYKENVARCIKMGVPNLPSLYINGQLKFRSIIPTKAELEAAIREAMEVCGK